MEPYQAPLVQSESAYREEPPLWSPNGRLGRLKYFCAPIILVFVFYMFMFIVGIVGAVLGEDVGGMVVGIVMLLGGIPVLAMNFILAIKRLHDLDTTGWVSLLLLVPLINFILQLYLWFAPGQPHANQYGEVPEPPSAGWKVIFWIGIVLFALGLLAIVAAIALPLYHDFVTRSAG
ncbi:MAG: DUF805 domain-containing protein [Acidobacteria bacterium]|nr:DUF805 domain-containing protein [Acidobacteriota bacterium]